jgi:hypothetical protein
MALTLYDWIYGVAQLAAAFIAIAAGILAIKVYMLAKKQLRAWKPLSIALVLFMIEEILGALKAFGVYSTPYLTHIIPSLILAFLIVALVQQTLITRGWNP